MVLRTGREAGLRERQPMVLKTKLSSRGTTRNESIQIRWFSWSLGGRLDWLSDGQRHSNESWKITLGSQRAYFKTGRMTAYKKTQLTLSQGDVEEGEMLLMMMMMSENHAMPVTGQCDSESGY
jgi:hypothetical protein